MKRRRVTALLPPEIYEHLERWAERDDRGVEQQAAHVIRQISDHPSSSGIHPVMGAPTSSHADWERALAAVLADIARRPGRLVDRPDATSEPAHGKPGDRSDTRR